MSNVVDDGDTILGFKTIQFHFGVKKEDLPAIRRICKANVPSLHTLSRQASFEERSFIEQLDAKQQQQEEEEEEEETSKLIEIASLFGDQAVLLDSSLWTKDITLLNQIIRWLGSDERCEFTEPLEVNTDKYEHGKQELNLNPKYRYVDAARRVESKGDSKSK